MDTVPDPATNSGSDPLPGPTRPGAAAQPPERLETAGPIVLSPADEQLCRLVGRVMAAFVGLLGVASLVGMAWLLYRATRWVWFSE